MFKDLKNIIKKDISLFYICIIFNIMYFLKWYLIKQFNMENIFNFIFYGIVCCYFYFYLERRAFNLKGIICFFWLCLFLYWGLGMVNEIYLSLITVFNFNLLTFSLFLIFGFLSCLFLYILIPILVIDYLNKE